MLSLYGDKARESADVKAIAEAKLAEIDRKIAELMGLRKTLQHLVHHCHGDDAAGLPDPRRAVRRGPSFSEAIRRVGVVMFGRLHRRGGDCRCAASSIDRRAPGER